MGFSAFLAFYLFVDFVSINIYEKAGGGRCLACACATAAMRYPDSAILRVLAYATRSPYGQQSVLFMKKSVGILSGLAIAIAVATTAGAWYTGKQLPAELDAPPSNAELKKALVGTGGSMTIELASLEQHFFSSTAHYRLKAKDINWVRSRLNFDVGVTDQIEHGPFPWSRVKAFKLMPVMATSNSALEKDDFTAPWFAAAGSRPRQRPVSLGYGGTVSDIRLAPVKLEQDGKSLDFSGMQLLVSGDKEGKASEIPRQCRPSGDEFRRCAEPGEDPAQRLQGWRQPCQTDHDMIYVGNIDLALAETKVTRGRSASAGDQGPAAERLCSASKARTSWVGAWSTRWPTSPMPGARWAARDGRSP
jgi:hypothetical protein